MHLSENERLVLETIRDGVYDTMSQVAEATGLPYVMARHYIKQLYLGGLIKGYALTYAGHKALAGEDLKNSDSYDHVDIRISKVPNK